MGDDNGDEEDNEEDKGDDDDDNEYDDNDKAGDDDDYDNSDDNDDNDDDDKGGSLLASLSLTQGKFPDFPQKLVPEITKCSTVQNLPCLNYLMFLLIHITNRPNSIYSYCYVFVIISSQYKHIVNFCQISTLNVSANFSGAQFTAMLER